MQKSLENNPETVFGNFVDNAKTKKRLTFLKIEL